MKYIDAEKLKCDIKRRIEWLSTATTDFAEGRRAELRSLYDFIDSLQQEEPEMELEKFTEKMDTWKARHNYPDNFSIKATMAFTGRMFYMYPNVAREWYDSLPKVTLD